jgi:hypothetical protein
MDEGIITILAKLKILTNSFGEEIKTKLIILKLFIFDQKIHLSQIIIIYMYYLI